MTDNQETDYGPLSGLIGVWKGDKGMDIAPEPDGAEENPYYETITFSAAGDVSNAESQDLVAIHYHQIVRRKSNDQVFHNETGYWIWEPATGGLIHTLTIPRAVCVLAAGTYRGEKEADGRVVLDVRADLGSENPQIIQSPFMRENAVTREFRHRIVVGGGKLSYAETTIVEIYGKVFEHTDQNELTLDT